MANTHFNRISAENRIKKEEMSNNINIKITEAEERARENGASEEELNALRLKSFSSSHWTAMAHSLKIDFCGWADYMLGSFIEIFSQEDLILMSLGPNREPEYPTFSLFVSPFKPEEFGEGEEFVFGYMITHKRNGMLAYLGISNFGVVHVSEPDLTNPQVDEDIRKSAQEEGEDK